MKSDNAIPAFLISNLSSDSLEAGLHIRSLDDAVARFIEEIRTAAWDAEYIWASWRGSRIRVSFWPPNGDRDRLIEKLIRAKFSKCKNHDELSWQIIWKNIEEEN